MPLFRLETNIARGRVPANFHQVTAELMARLLGKPPERCSVAIIPEVNMSRGGSSAEPCGFGTFISIGKLGALENRKHSAALFEHVERHLGIAKDRLVIHFIDEKAHNLGHQGTTFEELLESQAKH